MNDLAARAGRAFFGVALIGFAAVQFIYGDFVPGRAPAWPAGLPGQVAWVWISGALLIVAGGAIAAGWRARTPAIAVSVVIFVWALLRHVPLVIANPHGAVLTMAGKAVALTGGALSKNVFWQVSGRVEVGTTAHFEGVVLAATSVALRTGASLNGRLLAQTAVTIDGSTLVEPAR